MKTFVKLATAALLTSLLSQPADASTQRRVVSANKSTIVGFFHVLSGMGTSCQQPAKPKMLIERAPQHGTVAFRWARHSWKEMRDSCKGLEVGGWEVIYTPSKGYHGSDTFRIGAQYAQYVEASGSSYASDGFELVVK